MIIRCETGDDITVDGDTLVGADLSGRNLHRARLEDTCVCGANFSESELRSAWLERADFSRCNLTRANLAAVNATGTRFVRATLVVTMMRSGQFARADFTGANLLGAKVGYARFDRAILIGADMRAIELELASLRDAIADATTLWPDGFDPVKHGVRIEER